MGDERYSGYMYAAFKDSKAASVLADAGISDNCETVAFHCQQAAEKMIKAVYTVNGVVPPKTHDIGHLLSRAINDNWLVVRQDAIQASLNLTIYAVAARYETTPDISSGEAKKAIEDCNIIASMLSENGYDSVSVEMPKSDPNLKEAVSATVRQPATIRIEQSLNHSREKR